MTTPLHQYIYYKWINNGDIYLKQWFHTNIELHIEDDELKAISEFNATSSNAAWLNAARSNTARFNTARPPDPQDIGNEMTTPFH